jgi:hypothetical protein
MQLITPLIIAKRRHFVARWISLRVTTYCRYHKNYRTITKSSEHIMLHAFSQILQDIIYTIRPASASFY